jgi:putative GTP pyrophosphokinase
MSKPKEKAFLQKYNLDDDALERTGLEWNQLLEIYDDHSTNVTNLETTARYITDNLRQVEQVHSLKYRVKDPEHLLEKIIRKKLDDTSLDIRFENYREKITDLIGVRALHLFKEDWIPIHHFITATWDLAETPTANIRRGDSEELIKQFRELGCEITEHKYGYRSVHYLVESQLAKRPVIAEVQVRTIFEEGWSEIDHKTRYPYNLDNLILGALLNLFNRLAGSADEMGTFINFLRHELEARDEQHDAQLKELNDKIEKLQIDSRKKQELQKQVDRLMLPYSVATSGAFQALRQTLSSENIATMLQAVRAAELQRVAAFSNAFASGTKPVSPEISKQVETQAKQLEPSDPVTDQEPPSTKADSQKRAKRSSKKPLKKK